MKFLIILITEVPENLPKIPLAASISEKNSTLSRKFASVVSLLVLFVVVL